jgi:hypothetical protein
LLDHEAWAPRSTSFAWLSLVCLAQPADDAPVSPLLTAAAAR